MLRETHFLTALFLRLYHREKLLMTYFRYLNDFQLITKGNFDNHIYFHFFPGTQKVVSLQCSLSNFVLQSDLRNFRNPTYCHYYNLFYTQEVLDNKNLTIYPQNPGLFTTKWKLHAFRIQVGITHTIHKVPSICEMPRSSHNSRGHDSHLVFS